MTISGQECNAFSPPQQSKRLQGAPENVTENHTYPSLLPRLTFPSFPIFPSRSVSITPANNDFTSMDPAHKEHKVPHGSHNFLFNGILILSSGKKKKETKKKKNLCSF
jgi:hypothetical protein